MINFYILCKHLAEQVEKKQDITQIVQNIVKSVQDHKLDVEKEQND